MRGFQGGPVAAVPINIPVAQPVNGQNQFMAGSVNKVRPSTPGSMAGIPAGMRPPSSAGVPAGMRPPSQAGARLGTAAIGGMSVLTPLNTDVNVAARPVTQQGLSGMATRPLGPGRQIADKSYFLTDLKTKLTEITNEIARLREEEVQIQTDNNTYQQLERRYETVMKDVRQLEGQLADFNLALDKMRTHTPLEEIREIYERLRVRNENERNGIDEIFLKTQENEKKLKEYEEKIGEFYRGMAERVGEMGEEKLQEWNELQEENGALNERVRDKEMKLNQLDRLINQHTDTMKSEAYQIHSRGLQLKKEIQSLVNRREELMEEIESNETPEQLKERLTRKLKEINAEAGDMEKIIKQQEESVENVQEAIRNKESELVEAKKMAAKAQKYAAIYERDKKMTEFIENYDKIRGSEELNKKKLQDMILFLLKHLSKQKQTQSSLKDAGTGEKFQEMKAELSFKEEKMKNSKDTLDQLKREREKRMEELEKITSLDSKIHLELSSLREKMKSMQEDMAGFKSEEEVKEENAQKKKELLVENGKLKRQKEALKSQVAILSHDFEGSNKATVNSETHKRLETLESKLKTYAQTSFQLAEFVNERKRASEYGNVKKECLAISQEINKIIVKQQKQ